ncbi:MULTISPECIES: 3'-5' exonuclease [Arthrobacter]|uniref:3'-5' exonuclease n=1 Tax=Arthrobacter jinronghuae TaxID=2964609 RepID=A0ABT1NSI8_9MICC|nr:MULTISPECIES: 3'-5' exonuclease [Arthrobacter]MCQ1949434.1 3'-5' exonuclease [Arthrobacter jinronghuae]MCQ1952754.1 3'-5' exonuclease [Arthrobacter sp. zg-Y238]MCQ1955125.1 3'-5' exonuclease [Arthrobacter jinronghuae]UWX77791.1 3'-5' exonuclease [Arthrobacter jinronghuae]
MNSWHELPRAAFDLETTGRDPQTARIVTASIILVNGRGETLQHHEWIACPEIPIPAEAAAIHGITNERAQAEGGNPAAVTAEVAEVLAGMFAAGIPVLAFNACYDFTVLARECERFGLAVPHPVPVIDPYILDKQVDRFRRGKRTLTAMAEHYGVGFENAHTSAADVAATLSVAAVMAEKYPELQCDARTLHESQVSWAAGQAASFQEYLRRREPEAVIDGSWPFRAAPDHEPGSVLDPA